jgi:hypothetical protein
MVSSNSTNSAKILYKYKNQMVTIISYVLFLCNFSGIEIGCLLKLLNYTNGLLRYISKELQWRKFCQASLKTMLREYFSYI